jgi:hypothetical protein
MMRGGGIKHFITKVYVLLKTPLEVDDSEEPSEKAVGYYRVYGVNAHTEDEAKEKVVCDIEDGDIDWEEFSAEQVEPQNLDRTLQNAFHSASLLCDIWYRSGRIFHTDEP